MFNTKLSGAWNHLQRYPDAEQFEKLGVLNYICILYALGNIAIWLRAASREIPRPGEVLLFLDTNYMKKIARNKIS